MSVAASVRHVATPRSLNLPHCQADIAVLIGLAKLRGVHPNYLFSKGNVTRLLDGVTHQADRMVSSQFTGIPHLMRNTMRMLDKHGVVYLKPFSYGPSHDGRLVCKITREPNNGDKIVIERKRHTPVITTLEKFIPYFVGKVAGLSFGNFWEIAVEEGLNILPHGTREIRFLIGCDPTTARPKVYGNYGKRSVNESQDKTYQEERVQGMQIIDELSLGADDSIGLFRRCEALALSCATAIEQSLLERIPRGSPLELLKNESSVSPRHMCVDVVISLRANSMIEPCVLELPYPPGPGSDTGIAEMNPTGHHKFVTDFTLICAQDRSLINAINRN